MTSNAEQNAKIATLHEMPGEQQGVRSPAFEARSPVGRMENGPLDVPPAPMVSQNDDKPNKLAERHIEDVIFDLYKEPDQEKINVARFISVLEDTGLRRSDPRLRDMLGKFKEFVKKDTAHTSHMQSDSDDYDIMLIGLDREAFRHCIASSLVLVLRALRQQLVIPDWAAFCQDIGDIFTRCKSETGGKNAAYIPQLARVNPNYWAVAVCTIDGQRQTWGDARRPFCFQSSSKAFNYAIAHNDVGSDYIHSHVGQEPSGRFFNEIALNHNMKAHNPMINAGAITVSSLLKTSWKMADRFDWMMSMYKKFSADEHIGFSNQTFLSERETADRNYALAYYLRENSCFPPGANLQETLELYFQLCSMEVSCDTLALMGATLANGGVNPLSRERVVSNRACRDTMSLMHSCGMYDYSGQFAFTVGLPAKSAVSGAIVLVVPNEMGIALWAPPLDSIGNSVKGIKFCKMLVERFNFHNYDSILHAESQKVDPRRQLMEMQAEQVVYLLMAAKTGDANAIKQYIMQGMKMEMEDYDGRTALHIAASEGHLHIIKILREIADVNPSPRDRWNRTPLDDAKYFSHEDCMTYLEAWLDEGLTGGVVNMGLQNGK